IIIRILIIPIPSFLSAGPLIVFTAASAECLFYLLNIWKHGSALVTTPWVCCPCLLRP
ncbi:hypothetical protein CSUI_010605, partial [Cystoisospora suis]